MWLTQKKGHARAETWFVVVVWLCRCVVVWLCVVVVCCRMVNYSTRIIIVGGADLSEFCFRLFSSVKCVVSFHIQ